LVAVCCAVVAAFFAGCKKAAEIRDYTVNKPPLPPATHRMLAAIVPQEVSGVEKSAPASDAQKQADVPRAWFFKLLGPRDAVEQVASQFDQFVASIRTTKEGRPEWKLPEGWSEKTDPQSQEFGREAAIQIVQGDQRLELTIVQLPMPAAKDRRTSWLLQNINRWRSQLQLPALARSELDESIKEVKAGDETASVVDFRGVPADTGMMAGGRGAPKMPAGHPPVGAAPSKSPSPTPTAQAPLPFDADVPGGWTQGQLNVFSISAFNVGRVDGKPAEVTVTPLGPAAGELAPNVNRWRKAIGLPEVSPEDVAAATTAIEIDGNKADYVHLVSPENAPSRQATLGVILRRPDRVWFFKMLGPVDVVDRHKDEFEQYVKSVKFK
jgi:hypothetical protein